MRVCSKPFFFFDFFSQTNWWESLNEPHRKQQTNEKRRNRDRCFLFPLSWLLVRWHVLAQNPAQIIELVGMNIRSVVVVCESLFVDYTIAGSHWESIIQVLSLEQRAHLSLFHNFVLSVRLISLIESRFEV